MTRSCCASSPGNKNQRGLSNVRRIALEIPNRPQALLRRVRLLLFELCQAQYLFEILFPPGQRA